MLVLASGARIEGLDVDGIIAASVAMSSNLAQRCRDAGVPIVLFNRRQEGDEFSSVASDNFAGGMEVARFLVAGGHERFGFVEVDRLVHSPTKVVSLQHLALA